MGCFAGPIGFHNGLRNSETIVSAPVSTLTIGHKTLSTIDSLGPRSFKEGA